MMVDTSRKKAEIAKDSIAEDACLAARAAAGDPAAQRELVSTMLPHVRRLMSYMTRDPHLIDDLTQSALVRILLRADTYVGNGPLKTWASRVSTHTALNELKKLKRQNRVPSEIPIHQSPFPMAGDEVTRFMMNQKLAYLLSKLRKKYRILLILKHVEGYSIKEIASLIGKPENTIRGRLRMARALLRKAVQREPEILEQVLGRKTS